MHVWEKARAPPTEAARVSRHQRSRTSPPTQTDQQTTTTPRSSLAAEAPRASAGRTTDPLAAAPRRRRTDPPGCDCAIRLTPAPRVLGRSTEWGSLGWPQTPKKKIWPKKSSRQLSRKELSRAAPPQTPDRSTERKRPRKSASGAAVERAPQGTHTEENPTRKMSHKTGQPEPNWLPHLATSSVRPACEQSTHIDFVAASGRAELRNSSKHPPCNNCSRVYVWAAESHQIWPKFGQFGPNLDEFGNRHLGVTQNLLRGETIE